MASDTPAELITRAGAQSVVQVRYDGDPGTAAALVGDHVPLGGLSCTGETLRVVTPEPERALGLLVRMGSTAGLSVVGVSLRRPSLETAFLLLTGQEYRK